MNQNILFPDLQHWDAEKQAVGFLAQQAGALIPCFISLADLGKRAQQKLETEEAILKVFNQYRFDLEELAEEAIEEEDFNVLGEIWVR
ncbi:DUF1488 domain-containing protein [Enterovibrio paralichthyis]|uniref:DUF1488 domain-containing protein n=1 Tax=Enterovibrio paralichthyis TaxID=2853805 RepID=UPI001C46CF03|nr:DUF1488 domain-containing protein [Enterovibrio paralichthyis]MBV7300855.1 DUF1488 domain-containing protein [Enterovibrio paralichthyis]